MDPNPYQFSKENSRLVVNCERDYRLLPCAGAIFLYSMNMFYKKRFRVDGNVANLVGFTAGAIPSSIVFANLAFGSHEVEAGLLNNEKETNRG